MMKEYLNMLIESPEMAYEYMVELERRYLCNIAEVDFLPPRGLHQSTDNQELTDDMDKSLVDQRVGLSPLNRDIHLDLSDSIRLEDEREYPREPPPTY